jgi:hypothetical protein
MATCVTICLVLSHAYGVSGKLHTCRRSIFPKVIFPNIISWPLLASRDRS